ncbi:MAG: hypothetical protein JNJ56_12360 [Ignavibacteria bacterium]|nr:hypothetical protein [Ignavibacteria bacterium]
MTSQKNKIRQADIDKIEVLFSETFKKTDSSILINIRSSKINSNISVELFPDESTGYLVSVYTNNTHLQLQSCSSIIVSEMLEEVIFISETEEMISGLIVSKQGDCALYSNVNKKVLKTDFSELNSEKLLSAIALSITETLN